MPAKQFSADDTMSEVAIRAGYVGRRVALLTQHGKERAVAPVLQRALGCNVELVNGYDTDRLGTFTRDIPREGSQIETARRKAQIGMELSGLPLGLASEGRFGADPVAGMFPWNVELLVWIDAEREFEVVGLAQGNAAFAHLLAGEWNTIAEFAKHMAFPSHQLVVRADSKDGPVLHKGIDSWHALERAFHLAMQQSTQGLVFVESDGRAHANPTRMQMIERAAEDLARKLASLCPVCATPGFAAVEYIRGLPCAECNAPTGNIRAETFGCPKCSHRITYETTGQKFAEPMHCDYCNP